MARVAVQLINFTGGESYDPDYNISIGNLHDDVIQFPSWQM